MKGDSTNACIYKIVKSYLVDAKLKLKIEFQFGMTEEFDVTE